MGLLRRVAGFCAQSATLLAHGRRPMAGTGSLMTTGAVSIGGRRGSGCDQMGGLAGYLWAAAEQWRGRFWPRPPRAARPACDARESPRSCAVPPFDNAGASAILVMGFPVLLKSDLRPVRGKKANDHRLMTQPARALLVPTERDTEGSLVAFVDRHATAPGADRTGAGRRRRRSGCWRSLVAACWIRPRLPNWRGVVGLVDGSGGSYRHARR